MSYDVLLTAEGCDCEHWGCCTSVDVGDPTYNLGPMFHQALGRKLRDLDGMKCGDAHPILLEAIIAMKTDPPKFKTLNPANGWGDYEGALEFIGKFWVLCRRYPHFRIKVI